MKKDLPIYQIDGEKDERFVGVKLLGIVGDDKTTAEDCGLYWHIRDWEINDLRGYGQCWVSRSGYAIDKGILASLIKLVNTVPHPQYEVSNGELTGSAASSPIPG